MKQNATYTIEKKVLDELNTYAKNEGRNKSYIVENLLKKYLQENVGCGIINESFNKMKGGDLNE